MHSEIRRHPLLALLLFLIVPPIWAQDSTRALAEILAQKGIITAEQLARVERAGSEEGVRLLAAMLRDKGVLTPAESARFVAPAPPGAPAATVVAAQAPTPKAEAAPAPAPAPLTIYGTVLLNTFYNTAPTNNQDVPLLASKNGTDPIQNFGMSERASRLGARFQGPQIAGARFSGQLEFDLYGGKAAVTNGINMDLFRLRLAFGRLDWSNFALEAGQDWSIFAPLNPTSFASFGIPSMSASGNLWIRTPQIRAELHHGPVLWQIAATDPDVGDYSTAAFATLRAPGIGEHGRMPAVDTRLLFTKHTGDGDASIGLSSHYGRGKNTATVANLFTERSVDSWGVALDYTLPLMRRLVLTGEAYEGRALGIFSSASGESVLPVGTPGEHGVESRGGWIQAQINWAARWQTNIVYGLDAMNAAELRTGDRSKNQTYMTNLIFKLAPRLILAWEWRRFLTNYQNQRTANNTGDHASMAIAFTF